MCTGFVVKRYTWTLPMEEGLLSLAYLLCTWHQHRQHGSSQQYYCHMNSQSVVSQILSSWHHQEGLVLFPDRSMHWRMQLHLMGNTKLHKDAKVLSSRGKPELEYPSCLQTIFASTCDQKWSHTVPQSPLEHTSTLPSKLPLPPASLTSPLEHT